MNRSDFADQNKEEYQKIISNFPQEATNEQINKMLKGCKK